MFQVPKALRDEWYGKLKEETDFVDIEDHRGRLIDHGSLCDLSQRIHFKKKETFEIKLSYYIWASAQVVTAHFKCERDRQVWELHSEGLTGAEISEKVGLERTWVNRVIQKVRFYLKQNK